MPSPLVSVIVPCYNQGHFLTDALKSVQCQTYPNWECLIINDGSSDNTRVMATELAGADRRFRYIEQENRGLSGARNRGLVESSGEFVQFLDADDAIKASKFEKQVQAAVATNGLVVVSCDYYRAVETDLGQEQPTRYVDPRFKGDDALMELATRWETAGLSIPPHCFLFDARFFREHGIRFDERLPNHEDWDCWMRIFALHPRVVFVDEKLAIYRLQTASMCTNVSKMRKGYLKALSKQLALNRHIPALANALRQKRHEVRRVYRKYALDYRIMRFILRTCRVLWRQAMVRARVVPPTS